MHLALVGVAMAQEHDLFENEEHENAGEERSEHDWRRQCVQRFRQEREQRDTKQRADRVADEPRHDAGTDAIGEQKQRGGEEQAAATAQYAEREDGREQGHATF